MVTVQQTASNIQFDFDYYRFNGKGNQPSLVPTYDQANFIRSRQSIRGRDMSCFKDQEGGLARHMSLDSSV